MTTRATVAYVLNLPFLVSLCIKRYVTYVNLLFWLPVLSMVPLFFRVRGRTVCLCTPTIDEVAGSSHEESERACVLHEARHGPKRLEASTELREGDAQRIADQRLDASQLLRFVHEGALKML